MSFEEAITTQPSWVQWWINWMGFVIIGSMLALLFSKTVRRDSAVILMTSLAVFFLMMWLYQQIGFVRLLGIAHVAIWTPLAIYFWHRLKNPAIIAPFRQVILGVSRDDRCLPHIRLYRCRSIPAGGTGEHGARLE